MGFVATTFITGDLLWGMLAAVTAINSMVDVRRTRRSWRYLKAIHTAARTV